MTKKHFNAIAKIILDAKATGQDNPLAEAVRNEIAVKLAYEVCRGANPRFDVNRFIAACDCGGYGPTGQRLRDELAKLTA